MNVQTKCSHIQNVYGSVNSLCFVFLFRLAHILNQNAQTQASKTWHYAGSVATLSPVHVLAFAHNPGAEYKVNADVPRNSTMLYVEK